MTGTGEADALGHSAMPLWHTGRYADALKRLNQALAVYREIADPRGECVTLNNLADVQQHLGFHDEALDHYQQALLIIRELGDRQREAILFNNIGNLCQRAGRYDESLKHYRNALSIYREIGDRRCEADALNNIGAAFYHAGHYGEALSHHQKALVLAHELAEPYQEARSHCSIGDVRLGPGTTPPRSMTTARRSSSRRIGDVYQEALAHDGLGRVLLRAEGAAAARKHWHRALELFERIGVPEANAVRRRLRTAAPPRRQAARYADVVPASIDGAAHGRPDHDGDRHGGRGQGSGVHDRRGQAMPGRPRTANQGQAPWPPGWAGRAQGRAGRSRLRCPGRGTGPRSRRAGAEDPEFGTQIRELSRQVGMLAAAGDQGTVNVFHGRANKVVQLRDVHGDLSIG